MFAICDNPKCEKVVPLAESYPFKDQKGWKRHACSKECLVPAYKFHGFPKRLVELKEAA